MNKKKGSLHVKMLSMALIPIFMLGIVITLFSIHTFRNGMYNEVREGLRSICISLSKIYESEYPGDFQLITDGKKTALVKGTEDMSHIETAFDQIREETGIDITLFFGGTRVVTTIKDAEGKRITGTDAHSKVTKEVIDQGMEMFYESVDVNGEEYFAYYMPICGSNGTCGMVFAGKPVENVTAIVNSAVNSIVMIALATMFIMALVIIRFANNMIYVINKIMKFWKEIATGNLSTELDNAVLERDDELGAMGHLTIFVQKSLRFMVEYDTLTQLYNRRTTELKLEKIFADTKRQGGTFTVAIADIDFFKKVNDTYYHECGDVVLKNVADILKKYMSKRGFAGRWGGEEFLLVFKNIGTKELGEMFDELFDMVRQRTIHYDGQDINVTITAGAAEYDKVDHSTLMSLLKAADVNLYIGKESGRNKYVL